MHIQVRSKPTASPADLEKLLRLIASNGINLVSAGGSNLELDGEFAFSVHDDDEEGGDVNLEKLRALLDEAGYPYQEVEPYVCWMDDRPGELHRCVAEASEQNLKTGRVIKDIAIGPPRKGRVPVQIYSVEVRAQANTEPPRSDQGTTGSK